MASAPQGDPAREVSPKAVAALRGVFQGDLTGVGDPGYENARRVWNGNVDRRPALVARCRGARMCGTRSALRARRACWCPCAAGVIALPVTEPTMVAWSSIYLL